MGIKTYCRKQPLIQAVRWTGKNIGDVFELVEDADARITFNRGRLEIEINRVQTLVGPGQWLSRDADGKLQVWEPDAFLTHHREEYRS